MALARAQVLRASPIIDPDVGLTLGIDVAERGGHAYSDRPPGTAWLAAPVLAAGARLDALMLARARARGSLVYPPGSEPFIFTYAERFPDGPRLASRQATAGASVVQAVLMGALGLGLIFARLRRRGIPDQIGLVVVGTLGVATLWGPYATMLFNHVTAATLIAALLLALDRLEEVGADPSSRATRGLAALAGALGAAAVATDYLLLVVVAPLSLLRTPARTWPWLVAGALPLAAALAAYHTVAFGAPWSIGYDHHAHFEFAQTRAATFSGSLPRGLWILLGAGRDAGVLVLSPVLLVGLIGLWPDRTQPLPPLVDGPRFWLSAAPWAVWVVLLALHRTPWGGEGSDHRYLIPMLPMVALGLARALLQRRHRNVIWPLFALLGTVSMAHVWIHLHGWRGDRLLAHPWLGAAVGLGVGVVVAGVSNVLGNSRPMAQRGTRAEESAVVE